ncbi:ribosome small subunit-dependent GTPase A [Paenibacillus mucilaginosus]|uniref:Small ribosomal subunit biogenesis GTPase RsgA n=1 Tax=Paenibacillus mucilaginosus (strain KNP414) TaxID=1036673 RepID=F8FGV2_PAEMK|nr:ribosome small subunit-dependent GTPase A [Paenibacillus mucilaginosus]AEI46253.1 RsgA2 [Paenibacillus mucilaginosus KNP414]MCG7213625.1 ribosome small subunit-dependent GTPase A [Paenibacillus mucilaginosus]WDM27566.1 ribosome small subunit-dependent GTPase A [Paenibacillus mucilaginosus]
MTTTDMADWGWDLKWAEAFGEYREAGLVPGRVTLEHKHIYRVMTEEGELLGEIAGRMRHAAFGRADYPAVGDWVALLPRPADGRATIHGVLPRRSKFSRKAAGPAVAEQIVAANVDTVFLVHALNQDFNLRRLERYLTLAYESGAQPVVLLSKTDLCADVPGRVADVEGIAPGVPIHAVSSLQDEGLEALRPYLAGGRTAALLGSSGAGKSTLVNRLYGEEVLHTGGIREGDDRGRHTTTHRELVRLPEGGLLIDTPGMRELQLWDADSGLDLAFRDIEALAAGCRFSDCSHEGEPGCAVQAALEEGTLQAARYRSYVKLQKELAFEARREDPALQREERDRWKKIHKQVRKSPGRH